jgi:basic membrane protein A
LLLVQAGASGSRPRLEPSPTGSACVQIFTIGYVADVAGLRSSVDAAGWRGVSQAVAEQPCVHADLALPARPSEYRGTLQAYAGHDLVIAGSFLLTDPVTDVARANPATHFLLVDPIVTPPALSNLAVLAFRDDQAAYLAGALAAMMTQTGVVAGVYGPAGSIDRVNRAAFEHGARNVRPDVRVLGAYQPAQDGKPYADPIWGANQARAFSDLHADVIFGAGGTTGQGARLGAAQAGRLCLGAEIDGASEPAAACLIASAVKHVDQGVAMTIADARGGRWRAGSRALGLADSGVGLSLRRAVPPGVEERLQVIRDQLASGALATGA